MPNYTATSSRFVLAIALAAGAWSLPSCDPFEPESHWECFNPDCSPVDSGISAAGAAASGAGGDGGGSGSSGSGSGGRGGAGASSGEGGAAGTACTDCAPTQVCDQASGECVQCLSNDDCESPTPVCTVDHRCVACTLDRHCPSTAPACNDDNTCVGCTDSSLHCSGDTPLCDVERNQCVQCLEHADCSEPAAARCSDGVCQPCTGPLHCEHLGGRGVCDTSSGAGECVQCTGTQYGACGTDSVSGRPFVCDSVKQTCTEQVAGSSGLCGECVSDAECPAGQLCVLQEFEGATIGYFCVWRKQAGVGGAPTSCSNARPYVDAAPDTTSIDGTTAEVCTLALATCPAHKDFRAMNCSAATPSGDAECGVDAVADGYCRLFESGPDVYRCTVLCGSDDDCPVGFGCDTLVTPRVCALR